MALFSNKYGMCILYTVFIRFLRHVLLGECSTIRTCSDYFVTEGGFLYYSVFLKLKSVNFWNLRGILRDKPKIGSFRLEKHVIKPKIALCFDMIRTCPYS